MKFILKFLTAGMLFFLCTTNAQAQSEKVISDGPTEIAIPVSGVCKMCKSRIENAALIKGVKFAEWDKLAQTLKVVYKPQKVSALEIHAAVATAGHDTDKIKAPNEVYSELPGCCAYRDGVEVH